MNETLSGKGYISGGEGAFLTSTGEVYAYHDGELTPLDTIDKLRESVGIVSATA